MYIYRVVHVWVLHSSRPPSTYMYVWSSTTYKLLVIYTPLVVVSNPTPVRNLFSFSHPFLYTPPLSPALFALIRGSTVSTTAKVPI
ncbi:hypothetical protein GGS26DRAFT_564764 [Hypomontagnella submonticulosa]|nr:hypothetical protein GGS26DRAFT_564764 [Hypomontagnella submonticulosa]